MKLHGLIAISVLSATLTAAFDAPVSAQTLQRDQIRERLQKQQTRGLKLAPAENAPAASTGSAGAAQKAPAVAVEQSAPAAAKVQPAATAPARYDQYDPDAEVNLTVGFEFDSAVLLPDAKVQLNELCAAMQAVDIDKFNIYGHTDASGSVEYNLTLSRARAREVKRYLVRECGIAEDRIEAIGMGETVLYDPAQPTSARNRRVEVQVGT